MINFALKNISFNTMFNYSWFYWWFITSWFAITNTELVVFTISSSKNFKGWFLCSTLIWRVLSQWCSSMYSYRKARLASTVLTGWSLPTEESFRALLNLKAFLSKETWQKAFILNSVCRRKVKGFGKNAACGNERNFFSFSAFSLLTFSILMGQFSVTTV